MADPWIKLATAWFTMFVVGTDLFVGSPLLPLIAADYQASPRLAGWSVTAFSLAYMVGAPLLGQLSDRIGRRRTLTFSLFAFCAANLLTASAWNFTWLLAARFLAGATAAGVSPSIYALVSSAAPLDRRATRLGVVVSGLLMSLVLGAPAGGLAGASLGWPSVFAIVASSSLLLAGANSLIWPADCPSESVEAPPCALTIAVLAPRLAPTAVWSTALYSMYTYLGAGLTAAGFSAAEMAAVIVFYGCGAICGALIGGRLADRLGARLTSGISLAGLCASLLLLRLAIDAGTLVDLGFGLTAAVAQMFFPSRQAGLANDFPAQRAAVLAWNNSGLFLGIALGSIVGGQAVAFGGFEANLTVSAFIAIAGWAINWAVEPSSAPPPIQNINPTT